METPGAADSSGLNRPSFTLECAARRKSIPELNRAEGFEDFQTNLKESVDCRCEPWQSARPAHAIRRPHIGRRVGVFSRVRWSRGNREPNE